MSTKPSKTKRRREQRKALIRRLRKSLAANTEGELETPVVAENDVQEKRIRRIRGNIAKTQPKSQIIESLDCSANSSTLEQTRTLTMVGTAVKNDWPITPEMRSELVEKIHEIATGDNGNKTILTAARVLLLADSINAGRERTAAGGSTTNINIGIGATPESERNAILQRMAERMGIAAVPPQQKVIETTAITHSG